MNIKIIKLHSLLKSLVLFIILLSNVVKADELAFRFNSAVPDSNDSLWSFPTTGDGTNGKMISLLYDWEPHKNFYLEAAAGYRSWNDVFEFSSMAYELSPGIKVTAGPLVFKLSQGIAWMPSNIYDPATHEGYQKWDFVTHLTVGLKDPKTGIALYLDRAHYSNGSAYNNPSLNYTGFMLSIPVGSSR